MKKYNFLKTRKIRFKPKNLFILSLGAAFLITQPVNKVFANPVTVTVNGTSYSVGAVKFSDYSDDLSVLQSQPWWGDQSLSISFTDAVKATLPLSDTDTGYGPFFAFANPSSTELNLVYWTPNGVRTAFASNRTYDPWGVQQSGFYYYYPYLAQQDDGDATYLITGQTYAGKTLTAGVSSNDPDGNGTVTSYTGSLLLMEVAGAILVVQQVLLLLLLLQKKENISELQLLIQMEKGQVNQLQLHQ